MLPDLSPNFTQKQTYYISSSNGFPVAMGVSGKTLNVENGESEAYQILYVKMSLKRREKRSPYLGYLSRQLPGTCLHGSHLLLAID